MDPAILIPTTESIPVHWAVFDTLLIVTFVLHILFMNVAVGAGSILFVRHLRGNGDDLSKDISGKLTSILALTINFGVAPLLFLQVNYGHLDYVSSVLMGGWWLGLIPVLIVSYYLLYIYKFKYDQLGPKRALVLFGSMALAMYVGFLLSTNMTMMIRPEKWVQFLESGQSMFNLDDPTFFPRYLHFMVSTLAVGGLFIALTGQWKKRENYVDAGMAWFTRATMVNMLIGIWFLIALPRETMLGFMGGHTLATVVLLAAIGMAMALLWAAFQRRVYLTASLTVVQVFIMALARQYIRVFELDPWFHPDMLENTEQYSSFWLFAVFLMLGLPAMGWLIRVFVKAEGNEGGA